MTLELVRTADVDPEQRQQVIALCIEAHGKDDFTRLFDLLPPDGLHVLAWFEGQLVGHTVATTRWLQVGDSRLLRTAYVDAVSTAPAYEGQGIGSAVMRALAAAVADYDAGCLETERQGFYSRLGWQEWLGPLAGRLPNGELQPTPNQTGIMVLPLTYRPLDRRELLSVEVGPHRIW